MLENRAHIGRIDLPEDVWVINCASDLKRIAKCAIEIFNITCLKFKLQLFTEFSGDNKPYTSEVNDWFLAHGICNSTKKDRAEIYEYIKAYAPMCGALDLNKLKED